MVFMYFKKYRIFDNMIEFIAQVSIFLAKNVMILLNKGIIWELFVFIAKKKLIINFWNFQAVTEI